MFRFRVHCRIRHALVAQNLGLLWAVAPAQLWPYPWRLKGIEKVWGGAVLERFRPPQNLSTNLGAASKLFLPSKSKDAPGPPKLCQTKAAPELAKSSTPVPDTAAADAEEEGPVEAVADGQNQEDVAKPEGDAGE